MNLAEALLPLAPSGVIAFVGAGGKTSALFRTAREAADLGRSVLVTTTTHMLDPRLEGRAVPVRLRPGLESPGPDDPEEAAPGLTFLASRAVEAGKVQGIHPSRIPGLRARWDLVLVEADGSRRLPVKAPGPHEPVLPDGAALVVGLIGLACLGRPMDAATVHRPEAFARITGCAPGEPIGWAHLAALAAHPAGIFKGATGARALLLNQADLGGNPPPGLRLEADLVLVCSLDPGGRE